MSIPFTWVYLIFDPFTGLHKIGKSDNPTVRLKQLCCPSGGTIAAAPSDYELVDAWLAPEETEVAMHNLFADHRVRGEWFNLESVGTDKIYEELKWWVRLKSDAPASSIRGSVKPEPKPIGIYQEDENF